MSARLRRVGPEDAALIARLEAEATDAPWSEAMARASLRLATTRGWIAERDAAGVGYVLASAAGGVGEILIVGVAPSERRQGLGRALMEAAQQAWRADGVTEAFLEVRDDNEAAQALYRVLGWEDAGVRRRYYRDGCDARVMRWVP